MPQALNSEERWSLTTRDYLEIRYLLLLSGGGVSIESADRGGFLYHLQLPSVKPHNRVTALPTMLIFSQNPMAIVTIP